VWRDRTALPQLLKLLQGPSPHNRRTAAEAIGRIGDASAVPVLLNAVGKPADRALEHSLTFALIEIASPEATAGGLRHSNPRIRRAALTALDQMEGGGLKAAAVTPALSDPDPGLRETAWWIVGRHAEWGGEVAGLLRERLRSASTNGTERAELVRRAAQLSRSAAVQETLARLVQEAGESRDGAKAALQAMAAARLKQAPDAWSSALAEVLGGDLTADALVTVRAVQIPPQKAGNLLTRLREVADDAGRPAELRLAALAAVPGGLDRPSPEQLRFLIAALDPERPVPERAAAAEALARARLDRGQLVELAAALKGVGPMEIERLFDAFARSKDEQVALALVEALRANPAKTALRIDALKALLEKHGPKPKEAAAKLYAEVDVGAEAQRAELEKLIGTLKGGDVRRGQAVFNSAKAACVACHAIGYVGGKVGPDLTRIAQIRSERDLLESLVFPSASLVRSYEPTGIVTLAGKTFNGLIRTETAEEIVLTTGADQEVRVPRAEIEEVRPSKVSVMPAGLDKQLTPQELADLIAFLKSCR
jgi:putative heme-binding domain-containing protein